MKPLKRKKRKPISEEERRRRRECWFYDHDIKLAECNMPDPVRDRCNGDRFDCVKEKYRFLASLSEKEREKWIERQKIVNSKYF